MGSHASSNGNLFRRQNVYTYSGGPAQILNFVIKPVIIFFVIFVKLLWECVVFVHRHKNRLLKAKYTRRSLVFNGLLRQVEVFGQMWHKALNIRGSYSIFCSWFICGIEYLEKYGFLGFLWRFF